MLVVMLSRESQIVCGGVEMELEWVCEMCEDGEIVHKVEP